MLGEQQRLLIKGMLAELRNPRWSLMSWAIQEPNFRILGD
jgi:hypothetical protein